MCTVGMPIRERRWRVQTAPRLSKGAPFLDFDLVFSAATSSSAFTERASRRCAHGTRLAAILELIYAMARQRDLMACCI